MNIIGLVLELCYEYTIYILSLYASFLDFFSRVWNFLVQIFLKDRMAVKIIRKLRVTFGKKVEILTARPPFLLKYVCLFWVKITYTFYMLGSSSKVKRVFSSQNACESFGRINPFTTNTWLLWLTTETDNTAGLKNSQLWDYWKSCVWTKSPLNLKVTQIFFLPIRKNKTWKRVGAKTLHNVFPQISTTNG